MNKELIPLEAWEELKTFLEDILFDRRRSKAFCCTSSSQYLLPFIEKVETALKEYEMEHTLRIRLENIVYEKSEVLRIIKEKRVNVRAFLKSLNIKNEYQLQIYNLQCEEARDDLTQEEFDLLKEILA